MQNVCDKDTEFKNTYQETGQKKAYISGTISIIIIG